MGMTPAKWQEFVNKSKMTKTAREPDAPAPMTPQQNARVLDQYGYGTVNPEYQGDKWTPPPVENTIFAPVGDVVDFSQMTPEEQWAHLQGLPDATMRGLARSGWSTVRGANTIVMKGIPAASAGLRHITYDPLRATMDAAQSGDWSNWDRYYGDRYNQTTQDMQPFYAPARAIENYANETQNFGEQQTWADPRGAEFNQNYKGYEKAVELAGDLAQFYGFDVVSSLPGAKGKAGDIAWRATDPFYFSDIRKPVEAAASKIPIIEPVVSTWAATGSNPFVRKAIVTAADGTPLETPARIAFDPQSYFNNAFRDEAESAVQEKPFYYQGMAGIQQQPKQTGPSQIQNPIARNTQHSVRAAMGASLSQMQTPVSANYQPISVQTPKATRIGNQQNNFGNTTTTQGTNFTNTWDNNGNLNSVTAGNTAQIKKGSYQGLSAQTAGTHYRMTDIQCAVSRFLRNKNQ